MSEHNLRQPTQYVSLNRELGGFLSESLLSGAPLLVSLAMISANAVSNDTARFLVSLLFICSVSLLILRMKKGVTTGRLTSLVFVIGFMLWYAFPALVALLSPNQKFGDDLPLDIDSETVMWTVAYLSLFLLSWIITWNLFHPAQPGKEVSVNGHQRIDSKRLLVLALVGCLLGLVPYLLSGLSLSEVVDLILESRAVDKPWLFTANLGNTTSAFVYVAQSAMVAGACLLWSTVQDRHLPKRVRVLAASVAFIVSAIIYFDQGTRSITALVLLPMLLLMLMTSLQRSRLRAIVQVLIIAIVLFFLLQFQLLFRTGQTRANAPDLLLDNWATLGGTSDYFTETLLAVRLVPAYHDYFHESPIFQFIISPIPRFIWADKPVTQVVWFYSLVRWGIDIYDLGGNTFPGIVGQYYMSWGWLGPILIGLILGWVTARTDAFLSDVDTRDNPHIFTVGAMMATWLLISYRVLSPGFFYPVIFAALIIYLSRTNVYEGIS